MFHPIDKNPVDSFCYGDVCHGGYGCRSVPVPVVGWAPNHVARSDFDRRFTFALCPATTGGDDQRLPERMCVPGCAGAGLEGNVPAGHAARCRRDDQGVSAHIAGEIVCRGLLRGLRSGAYYFQFGLLVYDIREMQEVFQVNRTGQAVPIRPSSVFLPIRWTGVFLEGTAGAAARERRRTAGCYAKRRGVEAAGTGIASPSIQLSKDGTTQCQIF